jgi:branched-chain amino acid transport system ATP-binding protein
MGAILKLAGVSKAFGKMIAVNDVSFEVEENQIFGIAGPNGAGKTTLFNVISGLPYRADGGRIEFKGSAIQNKSADQICKIGLARTFQRETVFETLSIFENVLVGAVFGHPALNRREAKERALEALEFIGLADKLAEQAIHLPLFEKKLLMLASALATDPQLLLLDEPAGGLNEPEMERSAELFQRIIANGVAIILIEHQLSLLLKVSKQIMILNNGCKLVQGPPDRIINDERVIEAYLGKRGKRAA